MQPKDLAFEHAPIGLAVLENRIIQLCNMQFGDTFGGPPGAFEGVPLWPSITHLLRITTGSVNAGWPRCS